jgi:hypothetical protein
MTKPEILELLKLLSALESWAHSTGSKFPDFLYERLGDALDKLTVGVLSG